MTQARRNYTVTAPFLVINQSRGILELEVPRNQRLINQLKIRLPRDSRIWAPNIGTQGRWVINIEHLDTVRDIVKIFYEDIEERVV